MKDDVEHACSVRGSRAICYPRQSVMCFAETCEMREGLLTRFLEKVHTIWKIYELFIYVDIHYCRSSFFMFLRKITKSDYSLRHV